MVEGIKVGGLVFVLCFCNGDFIGFECLKVCLILYVLKKVFLWGCRGKISFFIKYFIIKF